ncbi:PIN domain-containing protein [Legionella sp.]|uniref:PIN domain-containing protein n=1 Tax=Legionella sp. TaxID=459 RepID=UPI003C9C8F33
MAHLIVFCDACILYPAPIRDLLMGCALNDLVQLKWSDRVLNEWIDNLIKNRPDLSRDRLEKTKNDMNKALLDSVVEDYESIEKKLILPDEKDRHVLAAAIASKSKLILTANLKDFPVDYLSMFNIKACHPDDLFIEIVQKNKECFLSTIKECYQKLRKPPKTLEQYIATLNDKCHLNKIAFFINQNKISLI